MSGTPTRKRAVLLTFAPSETTMYLPSHIPTSCRPIPLWGLSFHATWETRSLAGLSQHHQWKREPKMLLRDLVIELHTPEVYAELCLRIDSIPPTRRESVTRATVMSSASSMSCAPRLPGLLSLGFMQAKAALPI